MHQEPEDLDIFLNLGEFNCYVDDSAANTSETQEEGDSTEAEEKEKKKNVQGEDQLLERSLPETLNHDNTEMVPHTECSTQKEEYVQDIQQQHQHQQQHQQQISSYLEPSFSQGVTQQQEESYQSKLNHLTSLKNLQNEQVSLIDFRRKIPSVSKPQTGQCKSSDNRSTVGRFDSQVSGYSSEELGSSYTHIAPLPESTWGTFNYVFPIAGITSTSTITNTPTTTTTTTSTSPFSTFQYHPKYILPKDDVPRSTPTSKAELFLKEARNGEFSVINEGEENIFYSKPYKYVAMFKPPNPRYTGEISMRLLLSTTVNNQFTLIPSGITVMKNTRMEDYFQLDFYFSTTSFKQRSLFNGQSETYFSLEIFNVREENSSLLRSNLFKIKARREKRSKSSQEQEGSTGQKRRRTD